MASGMATAWLCVPIRVRQDRRRRVQLVLKWDSGSGTYFGVDPQLDMIYILMEQTQHERARTRVAFKKLVYDAFAAGN